MAGSARAAIHFQDIVENHPYIITCFLPDTTILYANATAHAYFGLPRGGMVGQRWVETLPQEHQSLNMAELARYTPEKPIRRIQNPVLRADGAQRWVEWTSRAFFDEDGSLSYFQTVGVDVTDRKAAEERSEQLLEILEGASAYIAMADNAGRVLYVNPSLQRLLGNPRHRTATIDGVHPDWASRLVRETAMPAAAHRGVWEGETAILAADGTRVPVLQTIVAHLDGAGEVSTYSTVMQDISALREGERLRQQLLESLAEGVFGVDVHGRYTFLNTAACRLLGFADEQEALGANAHELSHHTRRDGTPYPEAECPILQVLQTGEPLYSHEEYFRHSDGSGLPVLLNAAPLKDGSGSVTGVVVSFQDISDLQLAREALRRSEAELAEAQQIAHLGNWVSDFVRNEIRWSDEVYRIFGLKKEEWGGNEAAFMEAVHPEDRPRVRRAIDESLQPGGPSYDLEHRILRPDGTVRIVHQRGEVAFDTAGRPLRMVGVIHDITERREAENLLQYLSYHDVLTELPNRTLFQLRVTQGINRARALGGGLALVHIGLDRFKGVNEGLGHLIGDRVLQQVARRLEDQMQHGETLARLAGDEFGALLLRVEGDTEASEKVERLLAPLRELFLVGEEELYVPGSAGVALYPHDTRDPGELLQQAEAAMHQAKREGGNSFRYYSGQLNHRARARVSLESRLRRAVDQQEGFFLHYQPRIESSSGRIVGLESLLRWQDPDGQVHPPGHFIPVLEQTGLIVELGEWIIQEAAQQNVTWREAGLPSVSMAVNLAAPQFRDSKVPRLINDTLERVGLPAHQLELEVTESMLMSDLPTVTRTLGQFRDMGVRVAMDDFGTGYSSLAYLHRFPIDILKIDRSFVNALDTEESSEAIIRTILNLADNLGMESVAEGVERPEQHAFLCQEGCQTIQGYLFARPAPAEACADMLSRGALTPGSVGGQ